MQDIPEHQNVLLKEVVGPTSLEIFKSHLDTDLHNQLQVFLLQQGILDKRTSRDSVSALSSAVSSAQCNIYLELRAVKFIYFTFLIRTEKTKNAIILCYSKFIQTLYTSVVAYGLSFRMYLRFLPHSILADVLSFSEIS